MSEHQKLSVRHSIPEAITTPDDNASANPNDPSCLARSQQRFVVPGALVMCARRSFLGLWKTFGLPFQVQDIGLGGLSLRHYGVVLEPGARVRLNILLPKCRPISVKGIVVWNKDDRARGASDGTQFSRICGVKFIDYGAEAWSVLGGLHRSSCGITEGASPRSSTDYVQQSPAPKAQWLDWSEGA